jgi:hypothetical protein
MRLFTGTTTLKAMPLNRNAYNLLRGWTPQEGEDPREPGYLVEYQDAGKVNVKGFAGYISWSPKDVFEKTYQPIQGCEFGFEPRLDNGVYED